MWNCTEIIFAFPELYKNIIIENILQNVNDQHFNKSNITINRRDILLKRGKFWPCIVEGVGFIEIFRVGSVVHTCKSNK